MLDSDPRHVLERLCRDHGEDFATLSRLIGKNPSYIQQFVRRGTPRRLAEDDRARLARYFGVDEAMLGGRAPGRDVAAMATAAADPPLVSIARVPLCASAGAGAVGGGPEKASPYIAFDPLFLKRLTASRPDQLSVIRVDGDSMAPTLRPGDDLMVDHGDGAARLRDGIYVLRQGEALHVKRLALHPSSGRVTVQSDNPAYPDWPDCALDALHIVGRVLWTGRRID